MLKIFNLNIFRWLAIHLSCLTMIFAPVALGKEAERFNKTKLSQIVAELGLDKKTTLGEFWEKSKAVMPGYVYRDLEAFVAANKNLVMPDISLSTAKGGNGQEVPVIRFTQNGKTQTVQIFDEPARWATFNGVGLSGSDLERVEDAFKRVAASDIKFKNEVDKFRGEKIAKQVVDSVRLKSAEYKRDFGRFAGFPRVTPQMWQGLTIEQRAGYIVKMQLMAMNARKVLALIPETKKNAPAKPKDSAALENFYNVFFSQRVQAEAGKATPSAAVRVQGTSVRTKKGVVNIPFTANTCVVAGYIGAYGIVTNVSGANRNGCSVDLAIATYKSNVNLKFVQDANDTCAAVKSTLIACNPIIYGYPAGKPACIDRTSAEYQHATHFKSPANKDTCDGKSKLASTDEIIQFNDKDYSNVQPREKQIAAIEADQKKDDYALTQSFIKGVLSKRDPLMIAMLEKGEWNLGLDEELVRIQSQFEQEIERAIKTCENDITGKHEPNQKLACDQLHRRWLFTERAIATLRDKACVKPALYIGTYAAGESSYADTAKDKTALNKKTIDAKGTALCECPGAAKTDFAQSCPVAPVVEPAPIPEPQPASADPSVAPKCDKPQGIAGFDYEKCKCEEGKKLKQMNGEASAYECEGSNWLPWVLGGLGLLALIAIFSKNKKPPQPPPPPEGCKNICTVGVLNPATCACAVVPPAPLCPAPKVGIPPSCACPAAPSFCTLPQKIYDTSTCQCTNQPGPAICPNNTEAPMGNLSQCPKCADGSYKTTTGCPSEGGSGNNTCTNPPCSGGLPGTGQ